MTHCSHTSTLNPPFFEDLLDKAKHCQSSTTQAADQDIGYAWSFPPFGRSFAEFWVDKRCGWKAPTSRSNREEKGLIPLDQVCSNSLVREEQDKTERPRSKPILKF